MIVRGQNTSDALDFSAYQLAAARTGALRATDHPIVYPTLGLSNEAGEVAGKVACGAIGDGTGGSTARRGIYVGPMRSGESGTPRLRR
jgi:hypothetical protein